MSRPRPLRVVALLVVVGCIASCSAGTGATAVDRSPRAGEPTESGTADLDRARWWAAVHGEPIGLAVDDDAIAVTSLDRLLLLDSGDGSTRWEAVVPEVADRPAIDSTSVAVAGRDGLYCFDRATGDRRFVAVVPEAEQAALGVLADGTRLVFVTSGGSLLAFAADTGAPRWRVDFPGGLRNAPRLASDRVVALWRGHTNTLRVLDAATGRARFETLVAQETAAPIVSDGVVFVAEGDGSYAARVRALDLVSGAERWSTPAPASFESALEPGRDGSDVAVVDHFGTVTLLDAAMGAIRWRQSTGWDTIESPTVFTDRSVVFMAYPDVLVALDRVTGAVTSAERLGVVLADLANTGGRLFLALRRGLPSRVEARDMA